MDAGATSTASRLPALLAGLALGLSLFSVYARLSFPRVAPAENRLGIISRTTDLGYSKRREVAILGAGTLAAVAGILLAAGLFRLAAESIRRRDPKVSRGDALLGANIALAPLFWLFPALLRHPGNWREELGASLFGVLAVAFIVALSAREFPAIRHGCKDALALVLGTGSLLGICLNLWWASRQGPGYRLPLLLAGPAALFTVWILLSRSFASQATMGHGLQATAHAFAPLLIIALYPFLYCVGLPFFPRHPLRILAPLALLWSLRRLSRIKLSAGEPVRVAMPYVRNLLVPLLLLLCVYHPNHRNYPEGRDMIPYAEQGQHLAWANRILHGESPGRDFFMLYGPLMEFGHAAWLKSFGVTFASSRSYFEGLRLLGVAAVYFLGITLFQGMGFAVVAALLLAGHGLSPRVALGLFALAIAFRASDERKPGLPGAAFVAVLGLFFSQETAVSAGIAILAYVAAEPLCRLGEWRRTLSAMMFGALAALLPVLLFLFIEGSLVATIRNLVDYPRYVAMGYANSPFPQLPDLARLSASRLLRALLLAPSRLLWYAVPIVYLAGFALYLKNRARVANGRVLALSIFGLVLFRAALGRSGPGKIHYVLPPALLLMCEFARRALALARQPKWPATPGLALYSLVATVLIVPALLCAFGSFVTNYKGFFPPPGWRVPPLARMKGTYAPPGKTAPLTAAVRFVRRHTKPSDQILAIPNDALLYFLADRSNPTRFDLFSQIVTDSHRREVRRDIEKRPPALIIYDTEMTRVDGIQDARQFPQALAFISDRYREIRRIGRFRLLAPAKQRTAPSVDEGTARRPPAGTLRTSNRGMCALRPAAAIESRKLPAPRRTGLAAPDGRLSVLSVSSLEQRGGSRGTS